MEKGHFCWSILSFIWILNRGLICWWKIPPPPAPPPPSPAAASEGVKGDTQCLLRTHGGAVNSLWGLFLNNQSTESLVLLQDSTRVKHAFPHFLTIGVALGQNGLIKHMILLRNQILFCEVTYSMFNLFHVSTLSCVCVCVCLNISIDCYWNTVQIPSFFFLHNK